MKLKLETRTEFCTECALAYYKPFYEPKWLAKIMWISAHKKKHTQENIDSVSESYKNGVVDGVLSSIRFLENKIHDSNQGYCVCSDCMHLKQLIAELSAGVK